MCAFRSHRSNSSLNLIQRTRSSVQLQSIHTTHPLQSSPWRAIRSKSEQEVSTMSAPTSSYVWEYEQRRTLKTCTYTIFIKAPEPYEHITYTYMCHEHCLPMYVWSTLKIDNHHQPHNVYKANQTTGTFVLLFQLSQCYLQLIFLEHLEDLPEHRKQTVILHNQRPINPCNSNRCLTVVICQTH